MATPRSKLWDRDPQEVQRIVQQHGLEIAANFLEVSTGTLKHFAAAHNLSLKRLPHWSEYQITSVETDWSDKRAAAAAAAYDLEGEAWI